MAIDDNIRTLAKEIGFDRVSKEEITDIHPHTTYSDGTQSIIESIDEAFQNNVWEKGTIEHGNPIDEDIGYVPKFLSWAAFERDLDFGAGEDKEDYTSPEIFPIKYENLVDVVNDFEDATMLNDADPEKIEEDILTLNRISQTGKASLADLLNYSLVVPHGIEIDYNPAIELSEREYDAVENYEDHIEQFLRESESSNCGINYVLASTHHVNTPFEPKYVKKDGLFEEMDLEERKKALEFYRKKEIYKILSLADRLKAMKVPEISGELMNNRELQELEEFIYGQSSVIQESAPDITDKDMAEIVDPETPIEKPGVIVIGSHPTLIERNENLLDVFREEQGLGTVSEIKDEYENFIYGEAQDLVDSEVDKEEILDLMTEEDIEAIYPAEALENYYRPVVEASEDSDNFLFEINGKGVERQFPSVFWSMIDENAFGSDAHRPEEQPSRSREYSKNSSHDRDTKLLAEKWIEMLEKAR
ncbi:hypothetical protein [Candidatus Nanohalovita haloferacivicina]|uniref:hypothetical protein n=1 Tax=Candidatus Nanohalovita haloferacivicina TaxID=2978046 RepID=UPI00325FCE2A|nr:hypothetical protein HBNXNv_0747 [Candidatus Nanohalobia archaeon BNXNv]